MGELLNNIRSGHTTPRGDFLEYITSRGFEMRRAEKEYERTWVSNMRIIKLIVEEKGRDVNVPHGGYDDIPESRAMGALLNDIRMRSLQAAFQAR